MPEDHFQRLLRCLELEAEAELRELAQQARHSTGPSAERGGTTLVGLVIRQSTGGYGGREVLTLAKRDQRLELPWSRLNPGTPVLLSEENVKEEAACRGVVTQRNRAEITIAVAEAPEPIADRPTYRLDRSSDEMARQRQREALRIAAHAERGRLPLLKRRLLGEEPPEFDEFRPWAPLSQLDTSQQEAVSFALAAKDFAIIHGPPGTGKTTTVVEVIRQAVRRGEKVLACAPSNLAVDNLFERLLAAGEKVIRIGHPARVLPELRAHTLDELLDSHPDLQLARDWTKQAWDLRRQASRFTRAAPEPGARREARDEAKQLLREARELEDRLMHYLLDGAEIVCATLTGLNAEILGNREYDLVVIDEAAQTTEPACWIPLLRSKKLVLAGDHCQLPPTITSAPARKEGFAISLMERLLSRFGKKISRQLTTQYRMHQQIMEFSSDEFYGSSLIAAEVVRGHLLADCTSVTAVPLTQTAVRFYDTAGSGCEEQAEVEGSSRENPGEAAHVAQQVQELLAAGVAPREIGVITPYSAQARLLRDLITEPQVEIDTVDGFQGREKEAIVISLVRSNAAGELGFLSDTRRMNVALTRARRKLIVLGDSSTLANQEFFVRMLEYFELIDAYGTVWELGAWE